MKNREKNQCKTSRTERKKKFNKFKDTLHKNYGHRSVIGISFCPKCNKIVKEGVCINGKWFCKNCS